MYGTPEQARMFYGWLKEEERADRCAACGECEDKCPQDIAITEWLDRVHQTLG